MPILVNLDLIMVKRKISLTELSEKVGISMTNLSLLKTGKVRGVRFSTLDAICKVLDCKPGDILDYVPDEEKSVEENDLEA
jgi:putative transcriptional regulator